MAVTRTFSIIKPDATRRNLTGAVTKMLEEAGLRGIHGLFLFAVDRDNSAGNGTKETITAVDRGFRLAELDTLWFAGDLEAVAFLRKLPGLEHTQTGQTLKLGTKAVDRRLVCVFFFLLLFFLFFRFSSLFFAFLRIFRFLVCSLSLSLHPPGDSLPSPTYQEQELEHERRREKEEWTCFPAHAPKR